MSQLSVLRSTLSCALLACGLAAQAQPDTQPGAPVPVPPDAPTSATPQTNPAPADAAAALKKQAGDVDQSTLLKETLTKTDRQYSLLRAGRVAVNYDLTYQYVGSESIDVGLDTTGSLTLFDIENTRAHTFTNAIAVDYGLLDNLTVSASVPFVSKFTQSNTFSGLANGIGDIVLSARFQPFVQSPSGPTWTLTSALGIPTGRSPFKTTEGANLSTGSGYATGTVGINASQVLDPVALFASLNFTAARSADNLNQTRGNTILTGIKPGKSIGFGAGFTYALSYNISTSVSFQETATSRSTLSYINSSGVATTGQTAMQVASILNFGLGVRVSPKTTINLSAGIGLTNDSPDFSLGLNFPLTFPSI